MPKNIQLNGGNKNGQKKTLTTYTDGCFSQVLKRYNQRKVRFSAGKTEVYCGLPHALYYQSKTLLSKSKSNHQLLNFQKSAESQSY